MDGVGSRTMPGRLNTSSFMKSFIQKSGAILLAFAAVLFSSCSTLKTVNVTQDAGLVGASVAVDLVAVNDKNHAVETSSIRDYWQNGASLRGGLPSVSLRFGQGQDRSQTVNKDWAAAGATKVVVIADLPGVFVEGAGANDPRRKVIPVSKASIVTVRVTPVGLSVETTK